MDSEAGDVNVLFGVASRNCVTVWTESVVMWRRTRGGRVHVCQQDTGHVLLRTFTCQGQSKRGRLAVSLSTLFLTVLQKQPDREFYAALGSYGNGVFDVLICC